jgi:TonB-linked SusC/RagA family outer membrane protein
MLFSLRANAIKQGDLTITLSAENITLAAVFKAIYQQTKMPVMYNNDQINDKEKVNVSFRQTKLDEVLRFLLEKKGYTWLYNAGYIVIRPQARQEAAAQAKHTSLRSDTSVASQAVSGKVTDAAGMPLIGATVQVKGTGIGATTDADGKFTLPRVSNEDVLVISSIGYETRELSVKGRSIMAQLNMDMNELDETVVKGYYVTTKRLNTGNVTTIKADDIQKQPVTNPLQALIGRVPGMFITQQSGVPGGEITVQIRGQNSISQGSEPLYLIDGVPYTGQLLPNVGDGIIGRGNPLNYIDPASIESIDVLKDADATAIYGSRGANGVILITTKKGMAGKTTLNVNLYTGWSWVGRKARMMNREEYLEMRREAFKNDDVSPDADNAVDFIRWDTSKSVDWQKELLGKVARSYDAHVSVSGGTTAVQYVIGGGYHKDMMPFSNRFSDQKASLHFNIATTSSNQKLRINLTGNYTTDDNKLPPQDPTGSINISPVTPPPYNPDGSLSYADGGLNPFRNFSNWYNGKSRNLVGNLVITYQIAEGLHFKTSAGYTNMQVDEINATTIASYINLPNRPNQTASADFSNNNISSWIIEPQINYGINLGLGKLDALIGTTFQENTSNGQIISGQGYTNDEFLKSLAAAPTISKGLSTYEQYKYAALYGRLTYNYDGRYVINITARRDGSSRFGPGRQFANFGAVGAGWIFSNEHFIKQHIPVLSFGKLRTSYGTVGNQPGSNYSYLSLHTFTNYGVPYQGTQGLIPDNLLAPDFAWEINKKLEAGLELGFWKDKILATASWFRNRSGNQLVTYGLPDFTGFGSITANIPATVQNTGWEFTLNTQNFKKGKFSWTSNFNLTLSRNKLVSYPNLESSSFRNLIIGRPLTIIQVFRSAGVDPETGIYRFYDSKGNFTSAPIWETDRLSQVDLNPDFYGGFQNTFTYKGFQLDIFFQFVKQLGRNYLFSQYYAPGMGGGYFNQPRDVLDRWQKPGDKAAYQKFTSGFTPAFDAYIYQQGSDGIFTDASFIRLKNLSFAYTLPAELQQKWRMPSARFYVQGQNLATITKYKGIDPENQGPLPPQSVWTAGLQLTF